MALNFNGKRLAFYRQNSSVQVPRDDVGLPLALERGSPNRGWNFFFEKPHSKDSPLGNYTGHLGARSCPCTTLHCDAFSFIVGAIKKNPR
jgi:hypothetical protein